MKQTRSVDHDLLINFSREDFPLEITKFMEEGLPEFTTCFAHYRIRAFTLAFY
jgi:hypothetical protein